MVHQRIIKTTVIKYLEILSSNTEYPNTGRNHSTAMRHVESIDSINRRRKNFTYPPRPRSSYPSPPNSLQQSCSEDQYDLPQQYHPYASVDK